MLESCNLYILNMTYLKLVLEFIVAALFIFAIGSVSLDFIHLIYLHAQEAKLDKAPVSVHIPSFNIH